MSMEKELGESLKELEDNNEVDESQKNKLLDAIKDFSTWLNVSEITTKTFDIQNINIEPFTNEDWTMKVKINENGDRIASFNPFILKSCQYEFFEVVILHEYFHLVVQGVPNKDDATKIKDYFGSDFMSLIDIEADFYVALYLKVKRGINLRDYWMLYFQGSKIFIDKWIRNKKFERFLGSILTINKLFNSETNCFDLYLPSISPVFTQEHMIVLIIKKEHIVLEEFEVKFEDFRDIKKIYIQPDHLTFEGYFDAINNFTKKTLSIK